MACATSLVRDDVVDAPSALEALATQLYEGPTSVHARSGLAVLSPTRTFWASLWSSAQPVTHLASTRDSDLPSDRCAYPHLASTRTALRSRVSFVHPIRVRLLQYQLLPARERPLQRRLRPSASASSSPCRLRRVRSLRWNLQMPPSA